MDVGAHILVSGLVQGVGFRYFVSARARKLGLSGYVCNLFDGSVEIFAEGERALIEDLIREVKVGPRAAHVADLKIHWREPKREFVGFIIK